MDQRRHRLRPHGIEQFAAGQEDHAGAAQGQHNPHRAGILREIMLAALDRADGDRIGDEERLEAGFDGEESGEAFEHDYG